MKWTEIEQNTIIISLYLHQLKLSLLSKLNSSTLKSTLYASTNELYTTKSREWYGKWKEGDSVAWIFYNFNIGISFNQKMHVQSNQNELYKFNQLNQAGSSQCKCSTKIETIRKAFIVTKWGIFSILMQ